MTKYIFDVTSISSFSKREPKQIIVLCHGYGGDGKDISILAKNWRRFLPDAAFLSPNAPEVCTINPLGYQWFDMTIENEETILEKTLEVEKKLNTFLDQVLNNFQLDVKNLALVGFSQGSMIATQTSLKKKEQINYQTFPHCTPKQVHPNLVPRRVSRSFFAMRVCCVCLLECTSRDQPTVFPCDDLGKIGFFHLQSLSCISNLKELRRTHYECNYCIFRDPHPSRKSRRKISYFDARHNMSDDRDCTITYLPTSPTVRH